MLGKHGTIGISADRRTKEKKEVEEEEVEKGGRGRHEGMDKFRLRRGNLMSV